MRTWVVQRTCARALIGPHGAAARPGLLVMPTCSCCRRKGFTDTLARLRNALPAGCRTIRCVSDGGNQSEWGSEQEPD